MKCAYHPDRDAVAACADCRKFICVECGVRVGRKIHCNACADQSADEIGVERLTEPARFAASDSVFDSAHTLARWVMILLAIVVLVDIIAVISDFAEISLLNRIEAGRVVTWSQAETNDDRQAAIGMAALAIFIITVIFFLMWIHRAYKNLRALGARDLRYSPGWAVGGWFVPFLNLVRPFQVVTEIWKASDPRVMDGESWRNTPSPLLIPSWWALWLITGFMGWFVMRVAFGEQETISELLAGSWALLISHAIDIPAAILAIFVVRGIDARQEEKHRHLTTVGQGA